MPSKKDELKDLPDWLGLSVPWDWEDLRVSNLSVAEREKWFYERISIVWDRFAKQAKSGGITELESIRNVLLRWAEQFEKEEKRLQGENPNSIRHTPLSNTEAELIQGQADFGEKTIHRKWEMAFFSSLEIGFRLSILENVLWRLLIYGDVKLWGQLGKIERRGLMPTRGTIVLRAVEKVLRSPEHRSGLKTKSDLYRRANDESNLGYSRPEESIPKLLKEFPLLEKEPKSIKDWLNHFSIRPETQPNPT